MTGDDDAVIPLAHHGDRIGADQPRRRQTHGIEQIGRRLQRVLDQMGDDLGVGVRVEYIAGGDQFLLQFGVVFDDAVVHHRQAGGDMRVRVALGGDAMRGPARVGDAVVGNLALSLRRQLGDAPDAAQARQRRIEQRQTGRVVTAILELRQSLDQDGNDVARGNGCNDAAH